jgi:hypothetical protein
MTPNINLLQTIYSATSSINFTNRKIIPYNETKSKTITTFYSDNDDYDTIHSKFIYFDYDFSQRGVITYSYNIELYKVPYTFLGYNIKKFDRYITKVTIKDNVQYSSGNFKNQFFFDTKKDNSLNIQKDIFDFLTQKYNESIELEKSSKIDEYVNDLTKIISKSVTRNNVLEKILDKNFG